MLEWIVLIVLVLLLLGAFAPRAGVYGTVSPCGTFSAWSSW